MLASQSTAQTFSSPIRVVGFDSTPTVGTTFQVWNTKKEAEQAVADYKALLASEGYLANAEPMADERVVPIIIKTDVLGTADAVEGEIKKLNDDSIFFKIIKKGVGTINESDMNTALSDRDTIIIGFGVGIDKKIKDLPEMSLVTAKTFDIIYKMSEWLAEEKTIRRTRRTIEEVRGTVKILKAFSRVKNTVGTRRTFGIRRNCHQRFVYDCPQWRRHRQRNIYQSTTRQK